MIGIGLATEEIGVGVVITAAGALLVVHGRVVSATAGERIFQHDVPDFLYSFSKSKSTTNGSSEGTGEVGENLVYISKNSDDVVQYVGITNDYARRAAEHLRAKGINIEPLMTGLSRNDARAVEQALIEIHGLGKNGGTLLNKINSIAKSNSTYAEQLQRGYDLLKSIGY